MIPAKTEHASSSSLRPKEESSAENLFLSGEIANSNRGNAAVLQDYDTVARAWCMSRNTSSSSMTTSLLFCGTSTAAAYLVYKLFKSATLHCPNCPTSSNPTKQGFSLKHVPKNLYQRLRLFTPSCPFTSLSISSNRPRQLDVIVSLFDFLIRITSTSVGCFIPRKYSQYSRSNKPTTLVQYSIQKCYI